MDSPLLYYLNQPTTLIYRSWHNWLTTSLRLGLLVYESPLARERSETALHTGGTTTGMPHALHSTDDPEKNFPRGGKDTVLPILERVTEGPVSATFLVFPDRRSIVSEKSSLTLRAGGRGRRRPGGRPRGGRGRLVVRLRGVAGPAAGRVQEGLPRAAGGVEDERLLAGHAAGAAGRGGGGLVGAGGGGPDGVGAVGGAASPDAAARAQACE